MTKLDRFCNFVKIIKFTCQSHGIYFLRYTNSLAYNGKYFSENSVARIWFSKQPSKAGQENVCSETVNQVLEVLFMNEYNFK